MFNVFEHKMVVMLGLTGNTSLDRFIQAKGFDPLWKPQNVTIDKDQGLYGKPYTGHELTYVGWQPSHLVFAFNHITKNKSEQKYEINLATFAFDVSNCGMMSVHNINNFRIKGLGWKILQYLELIALSQSRKLITASITNNQARAGSSEFLTRHGYKENIQFVGGNSGNNCSTWYKDLSLTPMIQEVIPKKELVSEETK
jgi:hypothetical protein